MRVPATVQRALLSLMVLLSAFCAVVALWGSLRMVDQPFPGFRYETTLTVSAVSDARWNGAKAKLQAYDRMLTADGQPLKVPGDLATLVSGKPLGTPIHYEFQREGKKLQATIATQRFTWQDWLTGFLPLILIGVLHLVVGAVAWAMKPTSPTARAHLYMCAAISLYFTSGNDYDASHVLAPLYLLSIPLLGSAFLHLGLAFPSLPLWMRRRPWLVVLLYVPALLVAGIWEVLYRPAGMLGNPEAFDTCMSMQDLSYLWVMIGLLGLIVSTLVRLWRSKIALEKQQIKIAVFGAAVAYLPGTLLWIVPYLMGKSLDDSGLLVLVSYLFFVAFPLSIAYAIVRHRLFDIDLIIKRTVVYTVVVAALTGLYFLTIALVTEGIRQVAGHADSTLGNMVATALVAIAFVPVRNRIQQVIDRIFFRNRYDFRTVVSSFARFSKEQPELDPVLDTLTRLVDETLHPRFMAVFARESGAQTLTLHRQAGLAVFPPDFQLPADSPEVSELLTAKRSGLRPSKATTRQLAHLETLGIAFVVPLEIRGEVLGMIAVGPKLSELDYTPEDEALLVNLGQQLASIIRIAEMTAQQVSRARIDAELETARRIQASLMPASPEAPAGLEVAGSSDAALEFGGDYFDVVTLDDGQLRVAVGDVAGKGVQAALVMAMAKSCFYNQVRVNPDLGTLMTAMNGMILGSIADKKHRKTTFVYASIDPARHLLRYAAAGHQPPHYYNALTGQVEDLPIPGSFPFGASKVAKYEEVEVGLNPGDVLVFYTDGVTEAVNARDEAFYRIETDSAGQEVVLDQLRLLLEAHHALSAEAIRARIVQAVHAWSGDAPQGDDLTLVVVKVTA